MIISVNSAENIELLTMVLHFIGQVETHNYQNSCTTVLCIQQKF